MKHAGALAIWGITGGPCLAAAGSGQESVPIASRTHLPPCPARYVLHPGFMLLPAGLQRGLGIGIENGKISHIDSSSVLRCLEWPQVNAPGLTLLPGAINAHMHGCVRVEERYEHYLRQGVTAVGNVGSFVDDMELLRQVVLPSEYPFSVPEGKWSLAEGGGEQMPTPYQCTGMTAEAVFSGPMLCAPGGYPGTIHDARYGYEVTDAETAQRAVVMFQERGAELIKLSFEPGPGKEPLRGAGTNQYSRKGSGKAGSGKLPAENTASAHDSASEDAIYQYDSSVPRSGVRSGSMNGTEPDGELLTTSGAMIPYGRDPWPMLDLRTARAAVRAAQVRDMTVRCHGEDVHGLRRAMEAGVDVLDHIPTRWFKRKEGAFEGVRREQRPVAEYAALLREAGKRGLLMVPTLAKTVRSSWDASGAFAALKIFLDAGGVLAVGTDSPFKNLPHGMPLDELHWLRKAGCTAGECLTALTEGGARALGRADIGTIRLGMQADLLLVHGDPLQDLSCLGQPAGVLKKGVFYDTFPQAREYG